MTKLIRIILLAALLLLAFFSLPFWLPGVQVSGGGSPVVQNAGVHKEAATPTGLPSPQPDRDGPAKVQNGTVNEAAVAPTQTQTATSTPSSPSQGNFELPAMTLVDVGWVTGGGTTWKILHPPAVLRWDPARAAVDWRLETGAMTGAYRDDEGQIFVLEEGRLTVLDGQSGQLLARDQIDSLSAIGVIAERLFPVGRQADRLYLRNYAMQDNLFVYDLQTGAFGEERWTVCEQGYPFDSAYLPEQDAFVTFCLDFSTGMGGYLTRLSVQDGTRTSVEIPALGPDEYMVGNGFALGRDHLAYVVDSDAGALVEVDLGSMQILRQAEYRLEGEASGWLQRALSWLLDLAAGPARAKRWMSQPAVSPGGRYLVVDGGFGIGGGQTTTAWLVDLASFKPVKEIELPRSPEAFHFAGEDVLYILLQTELPATAQALAFDLDRQRSLTLDLPTPGRVRQILP